SDGRDNKAERSVTLLLQTETCSSSCHLLNADRSIRLLSSASNSRICLSSLKALIELSWLPPQYNVSNESKPASDEISDTLFFSTYSVLSRLCKLKWAND